MILYSADIIGKPAGQARPRAVVRGRHAGVYSPSTGPAAEWRELVLMYFISHRPACLVKEPVMVALIFRFPRPMSHSGKHGLKLSAPMEHTGKPDVDNLAKLVLDAMVEARALEDDCYVSRLWVEKRWACPGEHPGVTIEVKS